MRGTQMNRSGMSYLWASSEQTTGEMQNGKERLILAQRMFFFFVQEDLAQEQGYVFFLGKITCMAIVATAQ